MEWGAEMSIIEILLIIILIILVGPTVLGFLFAMVYLHKNKRRQ